MEKNLNISDFQRFIDVNFLKKKDIAAYLSVSPAFITQLSQGLRDIPASKLALIKQNKDWDASMLDESNLLSTDQEEDKLKGGDITMSREVFEMINRMTETMLSQQRTIEKLQDQRSGNVQLADDAACADVG